MLCPFKATHRVVLPVSPPSSQDTNDGTSYHVGCMVAVIHRAGDGDEGRAAERQQQSPRLDGVAALVGDAKLCSGVSGSRDGGLV